MADDYPYGSGGTTPHIHRYSGGDCHLKIAIGRRGVKRYDLIEDGRRVKQSRLNEIFDVVREVYPLPTDTTRTGVINTMKTLLRNVPAHASDV